MATALHPQNDPPIERCERTLWIWDWEEKKMRKRSIKFVPSLYNIYEKVLVKAADKEKVKEIKVSIDVKNAIISVWNNGQRVDAHKKDEYWTKQALRYSSQFTIETAHGFKRSKKVFANHSVHTTDSDLESSENWSKVSFEPNLDKFGMRLLEDDTVALMRRRVVDLAGCLGNSVNVELDGAFFQFRTFEEYVQLYPQDTRRVYEKVYDYWEICICIADGQFDQVSFVNNFATLKGGSHVDFITSQVTRYVAKIVNLEPDEIKCYLRLFVSAFNPNPKFGSKTKETLTTDDGDFTLDCVLTNSFLKKTANILLKKKAGELKINKLVDARLSDTVYASLCTLILTEGDSGQVFAESGLSALGRHKHGLVPIRGKLVNVKKATPKKLLKNSEFQNIKRIIGLKERESYENVKELRYGRVMIMADQDHDGSHIKGLLISAFHQLWPSLLSIDNFLCVASIPICVAFHKRSEEIVWFYTQAMYEKWEEKARLEEYTTQRYKGLGHIDKNVGKKLFADLYQQRVKFFYRENEEDDRIIQAAFGKDVEARKRWLQEPQDHIADWDQTVKRYRFRDFFIKEIKHHAAANLLRSIPSMVDGFKPVNRKIMFGALTNKKFEDKIIKMEQFVGFVSGLDYPYGGANIAGAISGMAQSYVGSNNINLLQPMGQFGSREKGGKDKVKDRYMSTRLSHITRYLFRKADEVLLNYMAGDHQSIEPKWYMPVIPLILVNGCDGVAFGRRSFVPKYDPRKIIKNIKRLLRDEALVPLDPWYRAFAGEIEQTPSKNTEYTIKGVVTTKPRNTILIADLPLKKLPEKYISYLEKIKGIDIEGYKEDRGEDNVQFTLYLSKDQMADAKKQGLLNKFKLTTKVSTKNMYLFDAEGILKKYDTPEQILEEFFHLRLDFYERRKAALLRELKKGVLVLENKIGYIRQSSAGQILFFGMSFYDRCVLLKGKGFKSSTTIEREAEQLGWVETKEEVNLEDEVAAGGYNYLLDVAFNAFLPEDLEMLENEKNEKKREYEKLTTRNARELWLEDLDDLKRALITEYGYTK